MISSRVLLSLVRTQSAPVKRDSSSCVCKNGFLLFTATGSSCERPLLSVRLVVERFSTRFLCGESGRTIRTYCKDCRGSIKQRMIHGSKSQSNKKACREQR